MMSRMIIIAVAPTGAWGKGKGNPVRAEHIAEEVLACAQAGASVVHMHARDRDGDLTKDLREFLRATELIRKGSDIIIEASTGGISEMTAQERALPVASPHVDMASLNMGSINFLDEVYCNSVPDIRLWLRIMADAGVKPCLEIFDPSNITLANHLIRQGLIEPQFNFNFVFNYKWGMEFTPALLEVLKGMLGPQSIWGAIFGNNTDFSNHLQAALSGATTIRVGFEDSRMCNGNEAKSNVELVNTIREELGILCLEAAGPTEARKMLGIE